MPRDLTIINTGTGDIHVHAAGCADLNQAKYQRVGSRWDMTADSERAVVLDIYQGFEGLAEDGSNWRDFADYEGMKFFPCTGNLPEEPEEPTHEDQDQGAEADACGCPTQQAKTGQHQPGCEITACWRDLAAELDRAFDEIDTAVGSLDRLAELVDEAHPELPAVRAWVTVAIKLLREVADHAEAKTGPS
jgi:hypothetical protein